MKCGCTDMYVSVVMICIPTFHRILPPSPPLECMILTYVSTDNFHLLGFRWGRRDLHTYDMYIRHVHVHTHAYIYICIVCTYGYIYIHLHTYIYLHTYVSNYWRQQNEKKKKKGKKDLMINAGARKKA